MTNLRMWIGAAAALLVLAGCTIADVTVEPGEDRLVVEGVLRTDLSEQVILLHRSVQGDSSSGERGAEVFVTTPQGARIQFAESFAPCFSKDPSYAQFDSLQVRGTCYVASGGITRWVVPGGTYDLTIRTQRGEEAFARTAVPGAFSVYGIRTATRAEELLPGCSLAPLTPLQVDWSASPGAWGYLAPLTIYGLSGTVPAEYEPPDPLELVGVAVTARDTQLVLPAEFGVFERFQYNQDLLRALQAGLPNGTSARVIIAAADRNYINGVRGGTFNPSGQVRISSVVGDAVGVFGSLVPLAFAIDVDSTPGGLPPCT
jgi:hypothetical protein